MLVSWLTVIAEVISFLLLVAVLRYFLYERILAVIDAREQEIGRRLEEAEAARKEAELEKDRCRQQRQEVEHARVERLARVKEESETLRRELTQTARDEVETQAKRWRESIRRQSEGFLRELGRQAGAGACEVARRVLAEMADSGLQERMTAVFLRRLRALPEAERAGMRRALAGTGRIELRSGLPLGEAEQGLLAGVLREELAAGQPVDFRVSDQLLCGIELRLDGYSVSWEMGAYLRDLEQALARRLEEEAGPPDAGTKGEAVSPEGEDVS